MTNPGGHIVVRMGEFAVERGRTTLVALGLGSCVAVILYDPEAQIGSLAHVLLPSQSLSRDRGKPARTADTAVPLLVDQMQQYGASRQRIVARLVGGATMFYDLMPSGAVHIGERNVVACRLGLQQAGVRIRGEAVGGQLSRSVWFDVAVGTVTVRATGAEAELI